MGSRRVLVLTSTLPAVEGDGTPAFIADLATELAREYRVRVLAPAVPGAPSRQLLAGGVEVVRYRYFPRPWEDVADGAVLENVRARRSRMAQVPALLAALELATRREMRRFRPDLVHAHWLIPQGMVARHATSRVPLVVTTLGGDLYALNDPAFRAEKRRILQAAAAVTVMNREMRELAIDLGADPDQVHVMPMGARFATTTHEAAAPATRRHPLRVLAVGRLVEKKGFDVLLEALRLVEARVELEIVGDGPERAALEARAQGLPVTFAGKLPRTELAARYGQVDVAVFPSRRAAGGDQDGLPVALLEAMGAGCAIIASALPGIDEAIEEGHSGVLVPPADPAALARSLRVLADDAELREALGAAARVRAGRYSIEAVGEGYRALLGRVLAEN